MLNDLMNDLIRINLEAAYDDAREISVVLRTDRLEGCGFPAYILEQYADGLPLTFNFEIPDVRRGMSPDISQENMTSNLSFDTLHRVTIPYHSIVRIVIPVALFIPEPDKSGDDTPTQPLALVT